jgi:hypothetical protein
VAVPVRQAKEGLPEQAGLEEGGRAPGEAGAPDGQAGRQATDPVPAPAAGGQPAPETCFGADGGNGEPGNPRGPLCGIPVELSALELLGGS